MRILITGAAGFIGSHLNERMLDVGHDVWGLDNFLTGTRSNNPDVAEIDITDRNRFYSYANQVEPEIIVHCAASYNDPDKWHRDTDINTAGGINAALAALHHDAHLIYFQTILPPVSSYAISKIAAEQYMRVAEVPLTVFRMANIYGPRNLSGPIPTFYKRMQKGDSCVVVDTTRDMVFIEDLVDLVMRVVEERLTGTYDVCSGRQTSILELHQRVAYELGVDEDPPMTPPSPDDVQGTIDPAKGVPGWKPVTPLWEGIRKTVDSYRDSGVQETYTHLRIAQT